MNVLPVLAHPERNSVNDAMFATEVGGFAPEIKEAIVKVEAADLMIWQFPLWCFGLPAILNGWVDREFAMGRTYGGGHVHESGRFSRERARLSLITGAPARADDTQRAAWLAE